MVNSKLAVRAALTGLACGFVQGCIATPERAAAEEGSVADSVLTSMYQEERYVTGSRIPKVIDQRISVEAQSAEPLKIVKPSR
jgi:hypothetical protein